MKKKIILAITVILLVFLLAGCKGNLLEDYGEAVERTNKIEKGENLMEVSVSLGFSPRETGEVLKDKNIYFRSNSSFNHEKKQILARNYGNYDGVGLDFDYYKDGDNEYLKLPMVKEYISLSGLLDNFQNISEGGLPSFDISFDEEMFMEIQEKWLGMLEEENIFKGEKTVVSTQEGEIKATRYYFELTSQQIRQLVEDVIEIFKENDFPPYQYMEEDLTRNFVNAIDVNQFTYEVYVDIDGYIVEENLHLEFQFNYQDDDLGKDFILKIFEFEIKEKNWNIEKDVTVNLPKILEENTVSWESLKDNGPSFFQ